MSLIAKVLEAVRATEASLAVDGQGLVLIPAGRVSFELKELLRRNKSELLHILPHRRDEPSLLHKPKGSENYEVLLALSVTENCAFVRVTKRFRPHTKSL